MPHWKEMMDTDWLFAFDLKGKDCNVTILKIESGKVKGTGGKSNKKPVVTFREFSKPLAMNATNCKTLAAMYGNETNGWLGKKCTLFPTMTQFSGESVECIRIRGALPRVGMHEDDEGDLFTGDDSIYLPLLEQLQTVENSLAGCDTYDKALELRAIIGTKAVMSQLTKDIQANREAMNGEQRKELGRLWQRCDRQVAKLEKELKTDAAAAFQDGADDANNPTDQDIDPAEDFAR